MTFGSRALRDGGRGDDVDADDADGGEGEGEDEGQGPAVVERRRGRGGRVGRSARRTATRAGPRRVRGDGAVKDMFEAVAKRDDGGEEGVEGHRGDGVV